MQGNELVDLLEPVEFIAIAAIVLFLAYLALEHRDIVYAVFSFGIMASLVAGFFLLLEAPFIAGMQIAVYTGGISVLIIFGVLLLPRAQDTTLEAFEGPSKRRVGLLVSIFAVVFAAALALLYEWPAPAGWDTGIPQQRVDLAQSLEQLAVWLWGEHGIYVQMIALVMVTALVGAIAVLKMEKAERMNPESKDYGIGSSNDGGDETPVVDGPEEPEDEQEEVAE
ncbi:MAG: NADH-quinone oxidoreductase subunit J [Candidatus Thorarchaeota archaeon]|nr:MAG: NADH-quinone oxidoreductase subunit J [Candidatus Thorarchaeota archaeon]